MEYKKISLTDFKNKVGPTLQDVEKAPIALTAYGRPAYMLLSLVEYNRLKEAESITNEIFGKNLKENKV
jgi:PHD/YefM family antitoxin component YafN of YafNO toxin-antitoxin module